MVISRLTCQHTDQEKQYTIRFSLLEATLRSPYRFELPCSSMLKSIFGARLLASQEHSVPDSHVLREVVNLACTPEDMSFDRQNDSTRRGIMKQVLSILIPHKTISPIKPFHSSYSCMQIFPLPDKSPVGVWLNRLKHSASVALPDSFHPQLRCIAVLCSSWSWSLYRQCSQE